MWFEKYHFLYLIIISCLCYTSSDGITAVNFTMLQTLPWLGGQHSCEEKLPKVYEIITSWQTIIRHRKLVESFII